MAASSAMRVFLKLTYMSAARLVLVHRAIVLLESASASWSLICPSHFFKLYVGPMTQPINDNDSSQSDERESLNLKPSLATLIRLIIILFSMLPIFNRKFTRRGYRAENTLFNNFMLLAFLTAHNL